MGKYVLMAIIEPTDINPAPLTQILYAFADVSPDTGVISLTDSYADEQVSANVIQLNF
jgi:chitinase